MLSNEILQQLREDDHFVFDFFKKNENILLISDEETLADLYKLKNPLVARNILYHPELLNLLNNDLNLKIGFLFQAIVKLPYKKIMELFLFLLPEQADLVNHGICRLLQTNEKFKTFFCRDRRYVHLFNFSPANFHLDIYPDLKLIYDQIKELQLDKKKIFREAKEYFDFKDPLEKEQKDILNILFFMLNQRAILQQLSELNSELKKNAIDKGKYDEVTQKLISDPDDPNKYYKLLSNYLYKWAKDNGFSDSVKLDRELTSEAFLKSINEGHLFKDKAEGDISHGEWVHFVQWWCIVEGNKKDPFLLSTPAEIFSWIGRQNKQIWATLFEFAGLIRAPKDTSWRDAGKFGRFMVSDECAERYPVLHQLIKARSDQRDERKASHRASRVDALIEEVGNIIQSNSSPSVSKQKIEKLMEKNIYKITSPEKIHRLLDYLLHDEDCIYLCHHSSKNARLFNSQDEMWNNMIKKIQQHFVDSIKNISVSLNISQETYEAYRDCLTEKSVSNSAKQSEVLHQLESMIEVGQIKIQPKTTYKS